MRGRSSARAGLRYENTARLLAGFLWISAARVVVGFTNADDGKLVYLHSALLIIYMFIR